MAAGDGQYAGKTVREVNEHWFVRHAALWAQQSVQRQAAWNKRAWASSVRRDAVLVEEQDRLMTELEDVMRRMEDVKEEVPPMAMSSAALTEE